jgi:TPR repeat protein
MFAPSTVIADYKSAMELYKKAEYDTAIKEFRKGADLGEPDSQFIVGLMYALGQGVPQNPKEAFKWYQRSAIQSYSKAIVMAVVPRKVTWKRSSGFERLPSREITEPS